MGGGGSKRKGETCGDEEESRCYFDQECVDSPRRPLPALPIEAVAAKVGAESPAEEYQALSLCELLLLIRCRAKTTLSSSLPVLDRDSPSPSGNAKRGSSSSAGSSCERRQIDIECGWMKTSIRICGNRKRGNTKQQNRGRKETEKDATTMIGMTENSLSLFLSWKRNFFLDFFLETFFFWLRWKQYRGWIHFALKKLLLLVTVLGLERMGLFALTMFCSSSELCQGEL